MNIASYGFPPAMRERLGKWAQASSFRFIPIQMDEVNQDLKQWDAALAYFDEGANPKTTLIRKLKNRFPSVPLFVVAYHPEPEAVAELFRAGIDDLFFAPLNESNLLDRLSKPIGKPDPEQGIRQGKSSGIKRGKSLPLDGPALHPDIFVSFFGEFLLRGKKGPAGFAPGGKKQKALLAYLLYRSHRKHHKDTLIEKFWPDALPSHGRNSLNVALHGIRRTLELVCPDQKVLLFKQDFYQINPDLSIQTDVQSYLQYWEIGQSLEKNLDYSGAIKNYQEGVRIFRGEFMEKIPLEDWFLLERDKMLDIFLHMGQQIAEHQFEQKDYKNCLYNCARLLEKDPCLEEIHRLMMTCYLKMGKRDRAAKQYQHCCDRLASDLRLQPEQETRDLYQQIMVR